MLGLLKPLFCVGMGLGAAGWLADKDPEYAATLKQAVLMTVDRGGKIGSVATEVTTDKLVKLDGDIDRALMAFANVPPKEVKRVVATLTQDAEKRIATPYIEKSATSRHFVRQLNAAELKELRRYINYKGATPYKTAILGMAGPAQQDLFRMAREYHSITKKRLRINSTYRTATYQKVLRKRYGPKRAGAPGYSQHQHGHSVDCNSTGIRELQRLGLLLKHGFIRENPANESWHIEHSASFSRFSGTALNLAAKLSLKGKTGYQIHRHIAMAGIFSDEKVIQTVEKIGSKHGLPAGYMSVMARIESNFGKNMLNQTGASGWYQFMPDVARRYGIRKRTTHLKKSANAAARLAKDNKRVIMGVMPITPEHLYIAHQQGATGAKRIYLITQGKASASKKTFNNMALNLPKSVRNKYFERHKGRWIKRAGVTDKKAAKAFYLHWISKYQKFESIVMRMHSEHIEFARK